MCNNAMGSAHLQSSLTSSGTMAASAGHHVDLRRCTLAQAVAIGGGYIGLECAAALALNGLDVTMVSCRAWALHSFRAAADEAGWPCMPCTSAGSTEARQPVDARNHRPIAVPHSLPPSLPGPASRCSPRTASWLACSPRRSPPSTSSSTQVGRAGGWGRANEMWQAVEALAAMVPTVHCMAWKATHPTVPTLQARASRL